MWMSKLAMCAAAALATGVPVNSPETDLARHDFLYCGQWQNKSLDGQTMYLVRNGTIAWRFTNPRHGELSDCRRDAAGNILFARQFGATEIDAAGRELWNYDAPANTELHSIYPLGRDRVVVIENGLPARLKVIRKVDGALLTNFVLESGDPSKGIHGQFRRVRPAPRGHFLVAHLSLGKVVEYDATGKAVWTVKAAKPWGAVRLRNGNTLISGDARGYVREVDHAGNTVWEVGQDELPGIHFSVVQEASRLKNGNTLINNWVSTDPADGWDRSPQLVEVTPAKKVVWRITERALLGPASTTQILDRDAGQIR
jgi:hypothetical protein